MIICLLVVVHVYVVIRGMSMLGRKGGCDDSTAWIWDLVLLCRRR